MIYSIFKDTINDFISLYPKLNRLCVAYSGGLDSSVLLDLSCRFSKEFSKNNNKKLTVLALHVNHGLSENAFKWQTHCEKKCEEYACEFVSKSVEIDQKKNIEEQGRSLRYQFFEEQCNANDVLLTAHHLNDQSETLLFRFFRGNGTSALSGIPKQRSLNNSNSIQVLRPLLSVDKQAFIDYSSEHKVTWLEDESNNDQKYNRNFIRHNLLPTIRKVWPKVDDNLSRSARFFSETQSLLADLAEIDLKKLLNQDLALQRWGDSISLKAFSDLSIERKKNVIRFFLATYAVDLPPENLLLEILRFTENHQRENAGEVVWKQGQVNVLLRIFEGHLFIHVQPSESSNQSIAAYWNFNEQKELYCYHQTFQVIYSGSKPLLKEGSKSLLIDSQYSKVEVRFRKGGERCQPVGRAHSQSLKKLFQEYRIPIWERDTAPLFYVGDTLIAVADFWVCEGFQGEQDNNGQDQQHAQQHAQKGTWFISRTKPYKRNSCC
jgi:tRNA(Ile)-lysidine synthase